MTSSQAPVASRRLRMVYQNENYRLLEYRPTLCKPLLYLLEPLRLIRRVRLMWEVVRKNSMRVYYLMVDDSVVGYCVVTPGGRRLKCSTEKDIVIGPYYIGESYRGFGYSKTLIQQTLSHCGYEYESAYDWIEKENIASIKATEACGFQRVGELNVVGFARRLKIVEKDGKDWIYRYKKRD